MESNQTLKKCLSKLSGLENTLFWSSILYFAFIFALYAGYVALIILISLSPQFQSSFLLFLKTLPNSINLIFSLFLAFHLWVAVLLAFLTFISSLAADIVHKKSVKEHILQLLPPLSKSVALIVFLYVIMNIIGYVVGFFYPQIFESLFNLNRLPETASWEIAFLIFINNAKILFMAIMFSFIIWIMPIIITLSNGFTMGFVIEYSAKIEGFLYVLVGLLPHSIIEIPIILLGMGVSWQLGIRSAQVVFKKGKKEQFKKEFINAFWIFFLILVPMLFIAAIIEIFITVPLLESIR